MRIGFAIDALSPQLTGIGRYTWELCARFRHHPQLREILFYRYGRWFEEPERFLRTTKPPRGLVPPFVQKALAKRRFKNLLVHSPNFFLPPASERGLITVHDLSVIRFPDFHPPERVRQFETQFEKAISKAEHLITVSQFVRRELMDLCSVPEAKISAIPLGVAPRYFHPSEPAMLQATLARHGLLGQDYCLCVSTLEPRKGLDLAIRAFMRNAERLEDRFKLVIIGASGWKNRGVHDQIAVGTRTGKVKLLGYVPEADLPDLYAGAALFLYPSVYEGFGLPPIEAMASGVPTVVSSHSCLPETTGGAAMLVDPLDLDAFGAAIEQALADDDWRALAIKKGKEVATAYDWNRCAEMTINVYRQLGA